MIQITAGDGMIVIGALLTFVARSPFGIRWSDSENVQGVVDAAFFSIGLTLIAFGVKLA